MKPPSDTRLITYPLLYDRYGIPWRRQTILRMRRDGLFPEPLRLSGATVAWRCADIEAWIAARPHAVQGSPPAKSKPKA
jgi:predicted DNA-binding transcriptional regulator AlpA